MHVNYLCLLYIATRQEHSVPRQLQSDRRRKKRRRGGKAWPATLGDKLVSKLASRDRVKTKRYKVNEERRRRRRNRKRARSRIRLENRRAERKWRELPMARLLKMLDEQKADEEAKFLSENPLNLSSTRTGDIIGEF